MKFVGLAFLAIAAGCSAPLPAPLQPHAEPEPSARAITLYDLARVRMRASQFQEALELLERAHRADPSVAEICDLTNEVQRIMNCRPAAWSGSTERSGPAGNRLRYEARLECQNRFQAALRLENDGDFRGACEEYASIIRWAAEIRDADVEISISWAHLARENPEVAELARALPALGFREISHGFLGEAVPHFEEAAEVLSGAGISGARREAAVGIAALLRSLSPSPAGRAPRASFAASAAAFRSAERARSAIEREAGRLRDAAKAQMARIGIDELKRSDVGRIHDQTAAADWRNCAILQEGLSHWGEAAEFWRYACEAFASAGISPDDPQFAQALRRTADCVAKTSR